MLLSVPPRLVALDKNERRCVWLLSPGVVELPSAGALKTCTASWVAFLRFSSALLEFACCYRRTKTAKTTREIWDGSSNSSNSASRR